MGVVYEAVQESLGRHVALKVLPTAGLMSPTHLERFRREARAAARLHHTNIVPVFGVGEHEGVHYFAMQFIRGQGLDRVLHELARLRRRGDPAAGAAAPRRAELSIGIAQGLLSERFTDGERPADGLPDGLPTRSGRRTGQGGTDGSPEGAKLDRTAEMRPDWATSRRSPIHGAWPGLACRLPKRWPTRINKVFSTATSSRPTFYSIHEGRSGSAILAWSRNRVRRS